MSCFLHKIDFPGQTVNFCLFIPYIFWKLFFQRLIWHIWGPSTCILWPARFFVPLWEATSSISWNLVSRDTVLTKYYHVSTITALCWPLASTGIPLHLDIWKLLMSLGELQTSAQYTPGLVLEHFWGILWCIIFLLFALRLNCNLNLALCHI